MQLTPIASNMTEIETSEARILFSYRTPVAAYIFGEGFVKTDQFWSVTTSRHINKWLKGGFDDLPEFKEIPQERLNQLVQETIMTKVKWDRKLNMTEGEEIVLVKMAQYFVDLGWIDDDTEKDFDTLVEKICEPAPWDYDCSEVDS